MQKEGNGLSFLRGSIAYGAFAKFAVMFVALVAMIATSLALTVGTAAAVEESVPEGGVEEGVEPANIEGGGANLNGYLDWGLPGIVFEYNTSLNDKEPASAKNAIKFVVDVLDQDGNEIALPEGSSVTEKISLDQEECGVDAVVSSITIPGAAYENSYFWWSGTYKGEKYAVSKFYNVQYQSSLGYESYIAFTSPDATGYDYIFYPGCFAYNPTGTLHIVYRMNVTPELSVTDYYGSYDGQAHSGTVKVSAGVAEYSTDGVNWDTDAPTICDAGSATYYVRANYGGVYSDVQTLTLTVVPRNVTVNIQGKSETYTYDGKKHTVNGYEVTSYEVKAEEGDDPASIPDFDTDDVTLAEGVTAEVSGADAKTYNMGLKTASFACDNTNFKVTFNVKDGCLTINKRPVTFTGESNTVTYNRQEQFITGISEDNLVEGHTWSGLTYCAKGTNAGDYEGAFDGDVVIKDAAGKDVTANYEITKTAGALTISPVTAQVTVTITGNSATYTYDGEQHSVENYKAVSDNGLYTEADFSFNGTDTATGTDAGTYYMGLESGQYTNGNKNFTNVEFVIAKDGHLTIEPLRGVVLTIKGNSATHDYDGKEHSVEGFTAESSDPLFTESDWYFDGEAVASGTKVGTYAMGLAADQFSVASKNFADVTFDVTDGELEIVAADDDDADDDDADKDGSSKKHAEKDDDSAEDEVSDGTPKTGDATNALLPAALMAGAAAAAMAARTRRRDAE